MKKSKLFKQLVSTSLISIMLFTNASFSTGALAQKSSRPELILGKLNPAFVEYINSKSKDKYSKIPSPITVKKSILSLKNTKQASNLPQKFDLRNDNGNNYVTPVKNQGAINSCWAFAAMAALESNVLMNKGGIHDFSENNLVTQNGFDFTPDYGGFNQMSSAYFARWAGPVNEQDDPYPASGDTQDIVSRSGLSAQEHVQNIIYLPARTSPTDNDEFKNALMSYGAVDTAIYVQNDIGLTSYDSYYNTSTSAYCYYTGSFGQDSIASHEIAIVGWDDTYPKSNFKDVPPGDGAFICKNSWGTDFGDGGYFYVSYYDAAIGGEGTSYLSEPANNYDNIYQYDELGATYQTGYKSDDKGYDSSTAYFANVFSRKDSESLRAVSFYTTVENASYTISVEPDYDQNGLSRLMNSQTNVQSGTIPTAGYHTIVLNNPIRLTGNKFAVAVKLSEPGESSPICIEYPFSNYSSKATASAGQSYTSYDGTNWEDITSSYANTNVCLKAFTDNYFTRLYGSDRYATAVKVAQQGWSSSDYVVLASGEKYPDALCAVSVAKARKAPVLLTQSTSLPSETLQEIQDLHAKNIIIMGGWGAVSTDIENQLKYKGYDCDRIGGTDRYDTSVKAAEYLKKIYGSTVKVVLSTGNGFADSLSIASYAASRQMPILLTTKDSLPAGTLNYINSSNVSEAYVVGGNGVISDDIMNTLWKEGKDAIRLGGKNRYETNSDVINYFGSTFNPVLFASGENFPDALSGSAMAAATGSPVILIANTSVQDQSTASLIGDYASKMGNKYILGGKLIVNGDYVSALMQ